MRADNPPVILLIMGLACQLTAWPQSLVHALRRQGYRVVVFDNRDIGLSTEIKASLKGPCPLAFARYKLGLSVDAPYDLYTMAEDAVRLLDHLNISVAHVVGPPWEEHDCANSECKISLPRGLSHVDHDIRQSSFQSCPRLERALT